MLFNQYMIMSIIDPIFYSGSGGSKAAKPVISEQTPDSPEPELQPTASTSSNSSIVITTKKKSYNAVQGE